MNRPLLVTDDPLLLDDLLRLAAAAGTEVDVSPRLAATGAAWLRARVVVVGPDASRGEVPRRPGVVLVGAGVDDHEVWDRSLALGAEHVVFLPDAEPWLVDLLGGSTVKPPPPEVIGVVGGCGGAGASTVAVALALAAARRGRRPLLVDADPLGGGLDLLAGIEEHDGPRWPDVVDGPVARRLDTLPQRAGVVVLAWRRGHAGPPDDPLGDLLDAGPATDLVVVDVPRSTDPAARLALGRCDSVLVVVPAEVRACAAASCVVTVAAGACPDVALVVRVGPAARGVGVPPGSVAAALGLPLVGVVADERRLAADRLAGLPPGHRPGGRLATWAGSYLATRGAPAVRAS